MEKYEKPLVVVNSELAESVYATGSGASGTAKCDSIYMAGVWQAGDYRTNEYKANQGCVGCPANTGSGCGLLTHYVDSGYAASYDVDNGNRKPGWEKAGHKPTDPVW